MSYLFTLGWILAVALITYALHSSLTLGIAWAVARERWIRRPESRLWIWRAATIAPLPLTILAVWLPTPSWVPSVAILQSHAVSSGSETPHQVQRPFARLDENSASRSPRKDSRAETNAYPQGETGEKHGREAAGKTQSSSDVAATLMAGLVGLWLLGVSVGSLRLFGSLRQLRQWVRCGECLEPRFGAQRWRQLCSEAGVKGSVRLIGSRQVPSPLASGWLRPFVMVPEPWFLQLAPESQRAILAHELAHVQHRDAWWNLLMQVSRRLFFFQPLHLVGAREARLAAEYVADGDAIRMLEHPVDLARTLIELAERLLPEEQPAKTATALATQMTIRSDDLQNRVASALSSNVSDQRNRKQKLLLTGIFLSATSLSLIAIPRIQINDVQNTSQLQENTTMKPLAATLGLLTSLWLSAPTTTPAQEDQQAKEPIPVPRELQRFSGMMIGKLVDRDIERGSFTVTVDYVARVWENNRATNPRAAVGKTLKVEGVTGEWLDQLLLIRPGDSIEFEAQHREGNAMRFPGEWLKKVADYDPAEHPVPPEGFRGFSGVVIGTVEEKRLESRELVLTVQEVKQAFEGNRADEPESVEGKKIVLAGFWARMSEPFEPLKEGDTIRVGVLHRVPQSDHFTVAEFAEKVESPAQTNSGGETHGRESEGVIPQGMRGFRGILRGTLVARDVEEGTLEFRAQEATRVWRASRARDVKSCEGVTFLVKGISGKWLDVLLTLKPGDTIEVEAFHNGEDHLDFIQEHLLKVR